MISSKKIQLLTGVVKLHGCFVVCVILIAIIICNHITALKMYSGFCTPKDFAARIYV